MARSSDPDHVPSHRLGRRMFGDYPTTGPAYWIWLAGIASIGIASIVLMFALKA